MRFVAFACVALLASVAWLAVGAQAAISFRLLSSEYPVYVEDSTPLADYAVQSVRQSSCVVLSMENGLGGVVRFTYDSNISHVEWRADVLVAVHQPLPSSPAMATLDKADAVSSVRLFTAAELEKANKAPDLARRAAERRADGVVDAVAQQEARSTTMTLRPAQQGTGPGATPIDGNYAVCFRLRRSKESTKKSPTMQYETVTIHLLEVASTRHSASTYIARLSAGTGRGITGEGDREYAKMLRSVYGASSTADLRALLDQEELVTSDEVKSRMEDLSEVQRLLFAIYSGSEHLEERFQRMRLTAESTFTRTWVCMILTLAVMGGSIWLTFRYTKGIIIKKKLI